MKVPIVFLFFGLLAASAQQPQGPPTPGSVLYTNGTNTFWTRIGQSIGGTSGNQIVLPGSTTYWPLYGNGATNQILDSSCGTRSILTEPTILTNLYFYMSAPVGTAGRTNTLTIFTNGVSTTMSAQIGGLTQTKATNTLQYLTISAGTEVGIQLIVTPLSIAAKYSWAISLKQ